MASSMQAAFQQAAADLSDSPLALVMANPEARRDPPPARPPASAVREIGEPAEALAGRASSAGARSQARVPRDRRSSVDQDSSGMNGRHPASLRHYGIAQRSKRVRTERARVQMGYQGATALHADAQVFRKAEAEVAGFAEQFGLSRERYEFYRKTSAFANTVCGAREPRTPAGVADTITNCRDGSVVYERDGMSVPFIGKRPVFDAYIPCDAKDRKIEAVIEATGDRNKDKHAWTQALAAKGMTQPKGTDFHHGPIFRKDGRVYILAQAVPTKVHHAFPHKGGFSDAKAAVDHYQDKPHVRAGIAREDPDHPASVDGKKKRQSKKGRGKRQRR